MKRFVLLIIFVLLISVFATSNATLVPIQFGSYILKVPLSLALILPLSIGLLIFTIIYLAKAGKLRSMIKNNNSEIAELQNTITQINKKVHQLEIENNKLKTRLKDKPFDSESL